MDIAVVIPHPGRANHADHAPVFLLQQRLGQGDTHWIVEHSNLTRSRVEQGQTSAIFEFVQIAGQQEHALVGQHVKTAVPQISHSERALVEELDKLVPRPRLFLSL